MHVPSHLEECCHIGNFNSIYCYFHGTIDLKLIQKCSILTFLGYVVIWCLEQCNVWFCISYSTNICDFIFRSMEISYESSILYMLGKNILSSECSPSIIILYIQHTSAWNTRAALKIILTLPQTLKNSHNPSIKINHKYYCYRQCKWHALSGR